jgi:hypothetical protein
LGRTPSSDCTNPISTDFRAERRDLERLLRHVRQQLGVERLHQMIKENTVSVRLPLEVCDRSRNPRYGSAQRELAMGGAAVVGIALMVIRIAGRVSRQPDSFPAVISG